jgi:DNA-binding response OmpR family regulator
MTAALERVRVLVVEDEYLVAVLIKEILESAGCVVMGPIPRLSEALDAVKHETYDAAVLDVNLAGERIDPVAKALSCRDVPFIFVTGYGTGGLPREFNERPRLCKPFKITDLLAQLGSLVRPATNHAQPTR